MTRNNQKEEEFCGACVAVPFIASAGLGVGSARRRNMYWILGVSVMTVILMAAVYMLFKYSGCSSCTVVPRKV